MKNLGEQKRDRWKKIGLLLLLGTTVFLLTFTRGKYIKQLEEEKPKISLNKIKLGSIIADFPIFQKKSELPAFFDGFYVWLFPNLSYSFGFEESFAIENFALEDFAFALEDFAIEDFVIENNKEPDAEKSEKEKTGKTSDESLMWEQIALENSHYEKEESIEQEETVISESSIGETEEIAYEEKEEQPLPEEMEDFSLEKAVQYERTEFEELDQLLDTFYTVDKSTGVTKELLEIHRLLDKDYAIEKDSKLPQILIYHTHSQEEFADSVAGDSNTTIVGAGEYLKELLEKRGYQVIHETGAYDLESRSTAYSNMQPVLEKYLEQYPSIEVMIDLHRDGIAEGKLVTQINGKPTAQFMFFNGLSYLNQVGDIDYLHNPYREDNLSFAFQLQYLCNQYYPGLARKIYLKGYRYNLHYRPRSLLIELGAQTNTREEIWNACEPLSDILVRVLEGEK